MAEVSYRCEKKIDPPIIAPYDEGGAIYSTTHTFTFDPSNAFIEGIRVQDLLDSHAKNNS